MPLLFDTATAGFYNNKGRFGFLGSAAPFTPALLFASNEPGVWYDPSDLTTLFQDSAGTTPVTADGQPVGYIADKSGNGFHATQATAAARPTYKTSGGLHWLDFDGTDDSLVTGNVNLTGTPKLTIVAGVQSDTDPSFGVICEFSANYNTNNNAFVVSRASNKFDVTNRTNAAVAAFSGYQTTGVTAPDLAVVAAGTDISAAGASGGHTPILRKNGASDRATAVTVNTPVTAAGYGTFPLYIGRRGSSSSPFNGRVYGLILRGAESDISTFEQAEAYMAGKTGVTL